MARPSEYTPEIAAEICQRLAEGKSLRKICKDGDMPGKTTVMRWLQNPAHLEFRDQYARARELQADLLADEIIEIADDSSKDMKAAEGSDDDGPPVMIVDHEHIQRSRLRVDARKWAAARLAPKKYGERVIAEHGNLDSKPFQTSNTLQTPKEVMDELAGIFGAAAIAAAVPPRAAAEQDGNDSAVNKRADSGGEL